MKKTGTRVTISVSIAISRSHDSFGNALDSETKPLVEKVGV